MNPCMPEWAPWDKNYPGSPCLIECMARPPDKECNEMCLTCGALPEDNKEPWWNRRFTWGRLLELEK